MQIDNEFSVGDRVTLKAMLDSPDGKPQALHIVVVRADMGQRETSIIYYCRVLCRPLKRWGEYDEELRFAAHEATSSGLFLIHEDELAPYPVEMSND